MHAAGGKACSCQDRTRKRTELPACVNAAAVASASTWCQAGHSGASRLPVWPQVARRLNVGPETQSVTFPGHPAVAMTFLGSKRMRVIYRAFRHVAGLGTAVGHKAVSEATSRGWTTAVPAPYCTPRPGSFHSHRAFPAAPSHSHAWTDTGPCHRQSPA